VLDNETMVRLSLVAIILLAALPIHEFSHALIAYRLGDGTAKLLGRLTLNPIVHFDPVGGTILILTLLIPGSGSAGRSRHPWIQRTCVADARATRSWPWRDPLPT